MNGICRAASRWTDAGVGGGDPKVDCRWGYRAIIEFCGERGEEVSNLIFEDSSVVVLGMLEEGGANAGKVRCLRLHVAMEGWVGSEESSRVKPPTRLKGTKAERRRVG